MSFSTRQYSGTGEEGASSSAQPGVLTHHQKRHVHGEAQAELHDHCAAIKAELPKHGFTEQHESEIVVALDVSASTENPNQFYFNPDVKGTALQKIRLGKMQSFLRTALSTAVEISPGEHKVTIFPFGKIAYPPVVIDEHDLEEAAEKVLASVMLFREVPDDLIAARDTAIASLMAEDQLNPAHYPAQIKQYLLDLKDRPEAEEEEVETAMNQVVEFMRCNLDSGPVATNYYVVTKAILEYYQLPTVAQQNINYDKPPIYVFFPTDGEANAQRTDATNLFQAAAYAPIFWHFIGLLGKSSNLTFSQLTTICKTQMYLPNRNLTILTNPSDLTIPQIFKGYRHYLLEAHEHHVLRNNPGVTLNFNDPDDHHEIRAAQASAQQHGHAASSTALVYGLPPVPPQPPFVPGGYNAPPQQPSAPAYNPYATGNRPLGAGHFGAQDQVRNQADLQQRLLSNQEQKSDQSQQDDCCNICTIL